MEEIMPLYVEVQDRFTGLHADVLVERINFQ